MEPVYSRGEDNDKVNALQPHFYPSYEHVRNVLGAPTGNYRPVDKIRFNVDRHTVIDRPIRLTKYIEGTTVVEKPGDDLTYPEAYAEFLKRRENMFVLPEGETPLRGFPHAVNGFVETMAENGIHTVDKLATADPAKLKNIEGVEDFIKAAQKFVADKNAKDENVKLKKQVETLQKQINKNAA